MIDALSRFIEKSQELDVFHGLVVGHERVEVSHLQFADDTIFLIGDKLEYWHNLLEMLDLFCFASGMKINKPKCSLVDVNYNDRELSRLAEDWGCEVGVWPMSYLGLPLGGNPRALSIWNPVVEKVEKRLQKWKKACLSKGGQLTLSQAVLSSIPIYYLSLFKMPTRVVQTVEKLMRDFLWEGMDDGKKRHLVNWEVVGSSKTKGGLGVTPLKARNAALCAKWLWRFTNEPNSLWHRVIKSIYGMSYNGWDANFVSCGSCHKPWKDISRGYTLFLKGCVFVVGSGDSVRFWEDDWCRGGVLKEVFPRLFSLSRKKQSSISSSVSTGVYPHNWNLDLRRNLTVGEIDEVIILLDILDGVRLVPSRLDKRRWKLDHSGLFSCHSFCPFTQKDESKEDFSPYSQMWKTKTTPKVKILLWQVARGRVNT